MRKTTWAMILWPAAIVGLGAPATSASGSDSDHIFTSGAVAIPPGETATVEIVLTGTHDGTRVPVVIRNNTTVPASGVQVAGIARDSAGNLTATGMSHEIEPAVLQPGDWAIGFVYFGFMSIGADTTFEFVVNANPGVHDTGSVPLDITEATERAGAILGIATNTGDQPASGPISVSVACFSEDSELNGVLLGYADLDEVQPAALTPFTVETYGVDCPIYAVAASGWTWWPPLPVPQSPGSYLDDMGKLRPPPTPSG